MELSEQIKSGMEAFTAFQSEIKPKLAKLDGLDAEKFTKLEKSMLDAIELSQKETAIRLASEAELKAQVSVLEAFIARPNNGAKTDNMKELLTKSFNDFAKGSSRGDFADYIKQDGKDLDIKALSVGNDRDGGYLVLPTFGGLINTRIFETSPMRQLATIENISSDVYEVVLDYDEAGASWVGETQTRSEQTSPVLGKLSIPVHELNSQNKVTQKLLDDGSINMEAWLAAKVADKIGRTEATAFISGNGVAKPRGILNYTSGTSVAAGEIQQVVSGSTSAFTYAGLANLQNALKEVYQNNATFLMKRASFGNIMQIVTGISGDNRPIFNMMYDKNTGLVTTILSRPVLFADDMSAIASAALSAAYGDFRTAYTIVDRIGLRTLRDPYTAKPYVVFDTTKRVGGSVVNFEAIKLQAMST